MNNKGLDKVGVMVNNSYIELTQKEEIKNACHEENKKKFKQTSNTSAIKGLLAKDLGFIGNSQACSQILNGYSLPIGTDEYTKDYLKALHKLVNIISPQKL